MSIRAVRTLGLASTLAAAALTAACGSDSPTEARPTAARADTLDTRVPGTTTGATRWVYVSLANPGAPVALTDAEARASAAWDVAFKGLSVKTNGGEEGPGGVSAVCLCQNTRSAPATGATAYFAAMTSASEGADLEAVTAAQIPGADQFLRDSVMGLADWWTTANGVRTVRDVVYAVNRPSQLGYAKLQFTAVGSGQAAGPGTVSFRYATVPTSVGTFAATRQATVAVPATGRAYFNFDSLAVAGGVVAATSPWDLAFEGWRVRTNSGTSATATVAAWGAVNLTATGLAGNGFDAVVAAQSVPPTPSAYRVDGLGAFGLQPTWYYDAASRTALPRFDVYLIQRGSTVHKLQVTGYRRQTAADPAPVSGFVALRTARLRD